MIKVSNVWKKFAQNYILKGISLEVKKGETLAVIGKSGCGKTVLLRSILGLESIDSGEIDIDGHPFSSLPMKQRYPLLKKMGMLFQSGALFDSLTVGENVAFYFRQHKTEEGTLLCEKAVQEKVATSLAMVGLEGIQDKMPSDLSGGMRKRAALARVICYKPDIILYDEPTTGLDPITARQIDNTIVHLQTHLQATSIVITHDLFSAMTIADRIALHDGGEIAYIASKEECAQSKHPQMQAFFNCVTL